MTLGLALILAFVVWENFAPYPMIPGYLFKHKVLSDDFPTNQTENLSFDTVHYGGCRSQFLLSPQLLAIGVPNTLRP